MHFELEKAIASIRYNTFGILKCASNGYMLDGQSRAFRGISAPEGLLLRCLACPAAFATVGEGGDASRSQDVAAKGKKDSRMLACGCDASNRFLRVRKEGESSSSLVSRSDRASAFVMRSSSTPCCNCCLRARCGWAISLFRYRPQAMVPGLLLG